MKGGFVANPPVDYTKGRVLSSSQEHKEEQQIKDFEAAIARLKNEYYLYFIGTNPKPPYKERDKLDALSRQIQRDLPKRTAQRFKMQQVLIRYQHMAEHWDRSIRGVEAGEKMPWVPISRRPLRTEEPTETKAEQTRPATANGAQQSSYLAAIKDASSQEDDVRKIFNSYVAAKAKLGGDASLTFDKFQQAIAKQTSAILAKGAQAVQFRVEISEDKVALKAKPVKE